MGYARRSGEDDKAKEAKKKEEALQARLEELKKADEAMRRHKRDKK